MHGQGRPLPESTQTAIAPVPLLPTPAAVEHGIGVLEASAITGLTFSCESVLDVVEQFRRDAKLWAGISLPSPRPDGERGPQLIHFVLERPSADQALAPLNAAALGQHSIKIDADGIMVSSDHREGLARGAASLLQLLAQGGELPFVTIRDAATWGWRGLSLDVVRHFVPMEQVKRIIDLLALYKFNVLHLHLTDNEGWRLAIPEWPLLTAGDGHEHFTTEDLAELTSYAEQRFVTLVPEIDLPGHVAAALRAYPELNPSADRLDDPFPVANLTTGSSASWRFLDDVLRATAEATAGPFLHVGGDEAFGMDDDEYRQFVERANHLVRSLGKRPIGWQETSRTDIGSDDIVQYWIDFIGSGDELDDRLSSTSPGNTGGDAAAGSTAASMLPAQTLALLAEQFRKAAGDLSRIVAKGAGLILSPNSNAYLDRPHAQASADPDQEAARPTLGSRYYPPTELRDYWDWDPLTLLTPEAASLVVGVEGALWGESISDASQMEALLLPRLAVLADVAWGCARQTSWDHVRAHLARHSRLWDAVGWNWFRTAEINRSGP